MMSEHTEPTADTAPTGEATGGHGVGKYLMVFGGLCLLTLLSFWIGNSSWKTTAPHLAWSAMIAVSCGKALLVILFFMHLLWEARWKYVLTIPASMMAIFLGLSLIPDIAERTQYYSQQRWLHASEPVDTTNGAAAPAFETAPAMESERQDPSSDED